MKKPLMVLLFTVVLGLCISKADHSFAQPSTKTSGSLEKSVMVGGIRIPTFVLKNKYAFRLIFPIVDRTPTQALVLPNGKVWVGNILHQGRLWSATIDPKTILSADVINMPILPGVFHFAACFSFGEKGLLLEAEDGTLVTIRELTMGTGPEKAFSPDGTVGFQLLQMFSSSMQTFEGPKSLDPKVRNRIDERRVNIQLFFLAEVEEAARLAALTSIRALQAEFPEKAENPQVQKYNFLGANCVSSGIQNLARAVLPKFRRTFLDLGKKDISDIPEWNEELARRAINSWTEVTFLSFDGLRGGTIDMKRLSTVSEFHKGLRDKNQMSLPWRGKALIDWAAGR
ncbi:MAG: hypothetical protein WA705_13105 [Candidatus Ozemobacteraceae bacterium]